jgi:hypothetical protein
MIRISALILVALVAGCADDRCDFVKIHDYPSPGGRIVLTTFEYCCYNTTGYDTHLQLRSPNQKLRVPGNIYTVPFEQEFAVSWRDASNVVVTIDGPIPDGTNVAGITVTFSKLPRTH